mgnify:CR=1 FL=1
MSAEPAAYRVGYHTAKLDVLSSIADALDMIGGAANIRTDATELRKLVMRRDALTWVRAIVRTLVPREGLQIYLLTSTALGYDTFDSCVVIATDEDAARQMHPADFDAPPGLDAWADEHTHGQWASCPADVRVRLIGAAEPDSEPGVVCVSFNAG